MATDGARVVRLPGSEVPPPEAPTGVEAIARETVPEADTQTGLTPPSRRGGSARFLTDVIGDLGLLSREQIESAVETARLADRTPERMLLEQGVLSQDALARALAERYGLDHVDLSVYGSRWVRRTWSPARPPGAIRRCRSASSTIARCWSRWPTRRTCWRSTTSPS